METNEKLKVLSPYYVEGTITLREALKLIDSYESFSIEFCQYNRKKDAGGEKVFFKRCVKLGKPKEKDSETLLKDAENAENTVGNVENIEGEGEKTAKHVPRNANHDVNRTRNIRVLDEGINKNKKIKLHYDFIIKFNEEIIRIGK